MGICAGKIAEESNNVEDRRQQSGGNGGGPAHRWQGRLILLVVIMVAGYYGVDLGPCCRIRPRRASPSVRTRPRLQTIPSPASPR